MNEDCLRRLAQSLEAGCLDAMLVCPGETLEFLAGFSPMQCERFQGLFALADGSRFYVCNLLYRDELHAAWPDLPLHTWFDGDEMGEAVGRILSGLLPRDARVAVCAQARAGSLLEIARHFPLRFSNGEPLLQGLRLVKTPEELDALRRAARIADEALLRTLPRIRAGMTEGDVRNMLASAMSELGGECPCTMAQSGPNSALPHYLGWSRRIEERDVLLMDFGCTFRGMHSDITRTVFVGQPTPKQVEVYNLVRRANEEAEALVCAGAFVPDIDRRAREVLDEKGYAWSLTSRLGHGIGRMTHEQPDIKASNPIRLAAGMAFSIEPGIYLVGEFGVRVEDIVVLDERGEREVLNRVPKDLIVL